MHCAAVCSAGAISSTQPEKRRFARESLAYNVRNPTFRKLFPEWVERHDKQQAEAAAAAAARQQLSELMKAAAQ